MRVHKRSLAPEDLDACAREDAVVDAVEPLDLLVLHAGSPRAPSARRAIERRGTGQGAQNAIAMWGYLIVNKARPLQLRSLRHVPSVRLRVVHVVEKMGAVRHQLLGHTANIDARASQRGMLCTRAGPSLSKCRHRPGLAACHTRVATQAPRPAPRTQRSSQAASERVQSSVRSPATATFPAVPRCVAAMRDERTPPLPAPITK